MTATLARWTARLAATAITALFIVFLLGEGTPDLRELTDAEIAQFGALLVMVFGALVAWRRDLAGAILLLAGYAIFAWIERGWPALPFAIYPLAAALLLLSALLRWLRRRRTGAAEPVASPAPVTPPPAA